MKIFGTNANKKEESKWLAIIGIGAVIYLLFLPFIIVKKLGKKVFRIDKRKV
jgi:hypothetical protein